MAEAVTEERGERPRTGAQALLVVLLIGGLGMLLLLTLAFSASNTKQSVGGTEATYSQFVDD